jgi:hypothetical protein
MIKVVVRYHLWPVCAPLQVASVPIKGPSFMNSQTTTIRRSAWLWIALVFALASRSLAAVVGLWFLQSGSALSAQQASQPTAEQPRAARLKVMTRCAQSLKVTEADKPVALAVNPILRYDDTARRIQDSTIWAWGTTGRPKALLKLELNPFRPSDRHWLYGVVSLSPKLIKVQSDAGWQWSASAPGLVLQDIPDAPNPAATESLRLNQMKSLARRFEAYEISGFHGRLQLRLLTQPIHRYSDTAAGLLDGAVFGFAYGTNPDVLVVVEAERPQPVADAKWRFGVARLGAGRLFVNLDKKEVWAQGGTGIPASKESYMNRFAPGVPDDD